MYRVGNLNRLGLNVNNDVHVVSIEANLSSLVADSDANISRDLLEVYLLFANSSLAE